MLQYWIQHPVMPLTCVHLSLTPYGPKAVTPEPLLTKKYLEVKTGWLYNSKWWDTVIKFWWRYLFLIFFTKHMNYLSQITDFFFFKKIYESTVDLQQITDF